MQVEGRPRRTRAGGNVVDGSGRITLCLEQLEPLFEQQPTGHLLLGFPETGHEHGLVQNARLSRFCRRTPPGGTGTALAGEQES